MTFFTKVNNRLIRVVDNKENIVGVINSPKLLDEIVVLLNEEC